MERRKANGTATGNLSAMTTVYKYCGPHGVCILENLELKITPPNQFNDPFEFTPQMVAANPLGWAASVVRNKKHMKSLYLMVKADGQFGGNFRDFQAHVATHRPEMAKALSKIIMLGATHARQELLDKASTLFGVLCLSERPDSILMWGHYADSHRGLVIGFDNSSEVFHPHQDTGLRSVDYVRQRVVCDASWVESDPKVKAFHDQAVFSKNDDWGYEKELRQCFRLSSLRQKPLKNGSTGYFLAIPPTALVCVTLGVRCPAELEQRVRLVLTQPRLSHVELYRAILHESDFALSFAKCDPDNRMFYSAGVL
jgi:hypothetical protein